MKLTSARRILLSLGCAVALLSGCGAPTSGTTEIDGESIPYGLLSPSPAPTHPTQEPSTEPGESDADVFFVGDGDLLVPVSIALTPVPVIDRVEAILTRLEEGPIDGVDDASESLSTALGPDVKLRVAEIVDTTAYVDLVLTDREPAADQIPLAIGQIVLTVTSVVGVTSVALLIDGQPVDVPLPGGQRTAGPVTAAQYQELVARPPP